jgi:hypothetical protein
MIDRFLGVSRGLDGLVKEVVSNHYAIGLPGPKLISMVVRRNMSRSTCFQGTTRDRPLTCAVDASNLVRMRRIRVTRSLLRLSPGSRVVNPPRADSGRHCGILCAAPMMDATIVIATRAESPVAGSSWSAPVRANMACDSPSGSPNCCA